MYKGVYEGSKVQLLNKKVLILGESHYSTNGVAITATKDVVNGSYRKTPNEPQFLFYHKIAQSFNVNTNDVDKEFSEFWDYVYFGNYVPEPCGIKDGKAKNYIAKYQTEYNNQLFKFINKNNIDIVFVFSRLTYNSMPGFSKEHKKYERLINADEGNLTIGKSNKCRDWISHCKYLANVEHPNVDIILNKNIEVYGMRHPSARGGYKIENYYNILGELFEDLKE